VDVIVDMVGRHVSRLSGYAPALPTPFDDGGGVDLSCLERYCQKQIHAGATALVVCATTGEAAALSVEERRAVVATAAAAARGGVPVIAALGSWSTDRAIDLALAAEAAGADAILCAPPRGREPYHDGLADRFRGLAEATRIPVIVHDMPAGTAGGVPDDVIVGLVAGDTRFIGLVDCTPDPARTARLRARLGGAFRLLSGDDQTAFAMLANGANGCVSITSNIAPGLCRSMYLAVRRGNASLARRIAAEVTKLNAVLCRDTDPAPVKYALSLVGLMPARVRPPLEEPDAHEHAGIEAALAHFCEHNPDDGIGLAMAAVRMPALRYRGTTGGSGVER
jgi:4-hydroxy-tetrahydrodipicolinate synthase